MSAFVIMPFVAASASPRRSKLARHLARLAILWTCMCLALPPTRAQEADPPPEAIEHYNRGRAHYQAGRYREAVTELEQALTLDPGSPNLVYNLARVYELLGDIDRAIAYYERYRNMLPETETAERERITTAIQRLEGAKTHVDKAPPPEAVVVRSERGVADGAFWTLASLSVAMLAAGTVTSTLAVRTESEAHGFVLGRDGDVSDYEATVDKSKRLALASDLAFAAGAIGGLTSILLFALRSRPVVEPGVAVANGGALLTLRVGL